MRRTRVGRVTDEDWPPGNTVLADLTSALGRRPDIVAWYVQAAADYPRGTRLGRYWEDNSERVQAVIAAGQVPMITWEFGDQRLTPGTYFPVQDIIDGRYDEYLDSWATGIRDEASGTVYLRPFHEMNLIDYAWSAHPRNTLGNTPRQVSLAWRHVVGRFRAAGTTNVRWVFNVGGDLANNPHRWPRERPRARCARTSSGYRPWDWQRASARQHASCCLHRRSSTRSSARVMRRRSRFSRR